MADPQIITKANNQQIRLILTDALFRVEPCFPEQ
jgi:hypothetical protein